MTVDQVVNWIVSNAETVWKWLPIGISTFALYYSRSGFKFQRFLKRREHIALINISAFHAPDGTLGAEITNPMQAPLLFAEGFHHHRLLGTRQFTMDVSESHVRYRTSFNVTSAVAQLNEEQCIINRTFLSGLRPWIYGPYHGLHSRKKPRKLEYGKMAIVEAFITDAARQVWYINSSGAKYYWPSWGLSGAIAKLLFRLRLRGYPFWVRLPIGVALFCAPLIILDLTLLIDHFFNDGSLLDAYVTEFRSRLVSSAG